MSIKGGLTNISWGLTTQSADFLSEKSVCNKGATSARFKVVNMIEKSVVIIYGMANFSIGLAKESSLKYVFI